MANASETFSLFRAEAKYCQHDHRFYQLLPISGCVRMAYSSLIISLLQVVNRLDATWLSRLFMDNFGASWRLIFTDLMAVVAPPRKLFPNWTKVSLRTTHDWQIKFKRANEKHSSEQVLHFPI